MQSLSGIQLNCVLIGLLRDEEAGTTWNKDTGAPPQRSASQQGRFSSGMSTRRPSIRYHTTCAGVSIRRCPQLRSLVVAGSKMHVRHRPRVRTEAK